MPSIFSKIVAGEIPCYKVAESDSCLAFLDINPIVKGHVLCIPKQEVDYIFDLDDAAYTDLQLFAKRVAKALAEVVPCKKVGVAVQGLDVPHAHIHLLPLNSPDDMDFRHHQQLPAEEMQQLATSIQSAYNK